MKTVFFVRHAKSSWDSPYSDDKERPLSKRGFRDAPFMAKLLKGRGVKADSIFSSPAKRALSTALFFAEELGMKERDIVIEEAIYEAFIPTVLQLIQNFSKQLDTVLVFGHNPTWTGLANYFSEAYIPNIPTCGVIKVEAAINDWPEFSQQSARVTEIHYPKQYFD